MKFRNTKVSDLALLCLTLILLTSCKEEISVFDPDYEPSQPNPVITNISPAGGYLAGVDSVIVTGENFATDEDSILIDFGGSPGVFKSLSKTELVVRPGTNFGENLPVKIAVRGAEFFSDTVHYTLFQPFGIYPGLTDSDSPTSPIAIDGQNNIYTIINSNGVTRYTKILPDGTKEIDEVKVDGEPRPNPQNTKPYPLDSTMTYTAYSDIEIGPGGLLLLSQQSVFGIFSKTFGDGVREGIWAISSNQNLKINDMVIDDNGFLWAVGRGTDQIHRFSTADQSEETFDFPWTLNSVAYFDSENELYVGGDINGSNSVWKFQIDGAGNIGSGELYFDFEANYEGVVSSMILASNGELLITTGPEVADIIKPSIIRVFPDGRHQELYPGMLKPGAYSITWRDDKYAVVGIRGDETSINFLDMYDRTRSGIFGF